MTGAREARIAYQRRTGKSPAEVAREAGIKNPQYLRQIERESCPLHVAERLARVYGCDLKEFLPRADAPGTGRPPRRRKVGRRLPERAGR